MTPIKTQHPQRGRSRFVVLMTVVTTVVTLALGACAPALEPGGTLRNGHRYDLALSPVILSFVPERGEGATYPPGERVRFRLRSAQDGYVSLSALNPDGRAQLLAEGVAVQGGGVTLIPPAGNEPFEVTAQPGLVRVQATFSPTPLELQFAGVQGQEGWTARVLEALGTTPEGVRDLVETAFFVRPAQAQAP